MKYNPDWVVTVDQNILWICQLPRSGGTLLLRLLDSHSQIHCYPSVFGFKTPYRIWPDPEKITGSTDLLADIFSYMDMSKFHGVGMKKQSSNMEQQRYPIYFNTEWYTDIFHSVLKSQAPRQCFDAFFTALFNAWQNYQNLYGEKKYIAGQMTFHFPDRYKENFNNFRAVYPDGKMVFMLRRPSDWLASALHLKHSTPFSQDPFEIMAYYKTIMTQVIELAADHKLLVFEFEDLIMAPEKTLKMLTDILHIRWETSLLEPSFNRVPFYQNSSFDLEKKSSIDPSVIGKGKLLDGIVRTAIDSEVEALYKAMLVYSMKVEKDK